MTSSSVNNTPSSANIPVKGSDIFQIYLSDEDGQSILSIDDGALRQSLRIEIVNTSGKNIELQGIQGNLSLTNCHFCISFRPGTLSNQGQGITLKVRKDESEVQGWNIQNEGSTYFLALTESANTTAKIIENGKRITLIFENIGASPEGGSRGTRVEIKYNRLQYQGFQETISGNRLQYLNIVNQRGKKQIPLYAGFLGSNTILNDGTENELTLSIQSLPKMTLPLMVKDYSTEIVPKQINPENLPVRAKVILDEISRISGIQSKQLITILNSLSSKSNIQLNSGLNITNQILTLLSSISPDISRVYTSLTSRLTLQSIIEKFKDTTLSTIPKDDLEIIIGFLTAFKFITPESLRSELSRLNIKIIDYNANTDSNQILNLPNVKNLGLLDEAIKFTISFDVAKADDSKQSALVDKTNADDIQISIDKGQENWIFGGKLEQGQTPQWSFVCKTGLQLTDRQEILRLSIKNLKTNLLSGYANLYVHYQNFPGYWDGYITVPIHKGPLVYRENNSVGCVGIGTDEPNAKLHVKTTRNLAALQVDGNTTIAGNLSVTNGKVGIGTAPGDEQLKVQGNTAIAGTLSITNTSTLTGKVGIGTAPGDEQLKVQGNTAIAGNLSVTNGKVGIGTVSGDQQLKIQGDTLIQGRLSVRSSNGISLGLQGSGGGELVILNSTNDNSIYLEAFSADGNSSAKNFQLTGRYDQKAPKITLNADETVITGNLTINGKKPIILERYRNLGDNISKNTEYSSQEYSAAIVGFRALNGDIQESGAGDIIQVYMYIANNQWYMRADFRSQRPDENWYVDVMFISNNLASRNGDWSS
ncbi:hypothetical protein H6G41_22855 [Tolypothrix sp. FACHB-123]|uniref:hypothetical protein n=1 Tax=Tolypothrix sp. FACHB-123 TaxID=2692868 RepID=UPI001689AB0E|nr:hypothetical protein [Tolypothrix sp. FACHB-123]MBD2357423.1 hypothetical protein [Tolypothrix sp. FACHB-123]